MVDQGVNIRGTTTTYFKNELKPSSCQAERSEASHLRRQETFCSAQGDMCVKSSTQAQQASRRQRQLSRARCATAPGAGQSMLEMAIFMPILLIILAGLVEFGMLANNYLTVLDASREAARFGVSGDPNLRDGSTDCGTTVDYYMQIACLVEQNMPPLTLDPTHDDIVISVFGVSNGQVAYRLPAGTGENGWSRYGNHTSGFTSAQIQAMINSSDPPTGVVLVEVFYSHHQVLALPFFTAFVPNPLTIRPYTIMPVSAAEPTPTPVP